ncbi:MAG: radical SAM protein [Bdellovibrionota bacterium]|nr:radical SAM protein [Bdellovibrionota bacterium]
MTLKSKPSVCLINPPLKRPKDNTSATSVVPPLGLAYIAAAVEEVVKLTVIDGIGEALEYGYRDEDSNDQVIGLSFSEIVEKIPEETDIIGMSAMFTSLWAFHCGLIKKIREKFPTVKIVLGGEHITGSSRESLLSLNDENIICVLGEGEKTFYELVTRDLATDMDKILGISYLKAGQVISNDRRPRIKKLDEISEPLWTKFPVQNYVDLGHGAVVINRKAMPLLYSRGCPFRCMFCSAPSTWGTNYYLRSPEKVIEEIKRYVENYQIDSIEFLDLVGVFNKKWLREFERLYHLNNLQIAISFSPGTRSESLDEEMLKLLKSINVIRIMYAPDSGSDEESRKIKKYVKFSKMYESMKICSRLGIPSRANIIIGFPDQKKSDLWNTFKASIKIALAGVDDVLILIFNPYAGSEFFEQLRNDQSSNLDVNALYMHSSTSVTESYSYSKNISGVFLRNFRIGTMALCFTISFLRRPIRLFNVLRRVRAKRPVTVLENLLFLKLYK